MIRTSIFALLLILCFISSSIASNNNQFVKEIRIAENSDKFNNLKRWLQKHLKDNGEDMQKDEIYEIRQIFLSKNEPTYFMGARALSGSGGGGGYLVKQIGSSYKLIYEGYDFHVTDSTTNGFTDIVSEHCLGALNYYKTYYKYNGSKYKTVSTTTYGRNLQIINDIKLYNKFTNKRVYSYKNTMKTSGGIVKSGVVNGRVIAILDSESNNQFKIMIIEDEDNDLLAMIVSNAGLKNIKRIFGNCMETSHKYYWKSIDNTYNPSEVIMSIYKVYK